MPNESTDIEVTLKLSALEEELGKREEDEMSLRVALGFSKKTFYEPPPSSTQPDPAKCTVS